MTSHLVTRHGGLLQLTCLMDSRSSSQSVYTELLNKINMLLKFVIVAKFDFEVVDINDN